MRLSGLEPFTLTPEIPFVNVGERTNVTGSARFRKLITAGDYDRGACGRARPGRERRPDHRRQHGRRPARFRSGDGRPRFLNLIAAEPDIARVPVMIDSSKFVIEAGLKCVQGKAVVNSISLKEGEEPSSRGPEGARYGAAVVVMAFDEQGQADTLERKTEICKRAYDILVEQGRLSAGRHHLRSQYLRVATGIEEHNDYGVDFIEATRWIRAKLLPHAMSPAASRISRSRSAATSRCARRCIRCSCITPSRPAWTWASSMPARWRSMTISIPNCARPARTCCSTAARRDRAAAGARAKLRGEAGKTEGSRSRLARMAGRMKRLTHALVHGITEFIEDTEEARAARERRSM
jgi:5-methyltetrahydrofolate--homocysteine methyltransferase